METLSQLITFDVDNSLEDNLHIPSLVNIKDEPVYPYRGLLLDTSRNYYSIESIKVRYTGINNYTAYYYTFKSHEFLRFGQMHLQSVMLA